MVRNHADQTQSTTSARDEVPSWGCCTRLCPDLVDSVRNVECDRGEESFDHAAGLRNDLFLSGLAIHVAWDGREETRDGGKKLNLRGIPRSASFAITPMAAGRDNLVTAV